ncbi:MAG: hypothetical protein ACI83D_000643 [Planctomycetota bacterium]|jgi:hypothetical protein
MEIYLICFLLMTSAYARIIWRYYEFKAGRLPEGVLRIRTREYIRELIVATPLFFVYLNVGAPNLLALALPGTMALGSVVFLYLTKEDGTEVTFELRDAIVLVALASAIGVGFVTNIVAMEYMLVAVFILQFFLCSFRDILINPYRISPVTLALQTAASLLALNHLLLPESVSRFGMAAVMAPLVVVPLAFVFTSLVSVFAWFFAKSRIPVE